MRGIIIVRPAIAARLALPTLLVAAILVSLASPAGGATVESDQAKIMHKAALAYMSVAKELISRGRYSEASDSLAKASENSRYLTESELKTLNGLLEQVHANTSGRDDGSKHLEAAQRLIGERQFVAAKAHLAAASRSQYLSAAEKMQVDSLMKQADAGIAAETSDMRALYNASVRQYEAGQLESAREGFMRVAASGTAPASVAKNVEYYLGEIAKAKEAQAAAAARPVEPKPVIEPKPVERIAAPVAPTPVVEAPKESVAVPPVVEVVPLDSGSVSAAVPAAVGDTPPVMQTSNSYMDQVMQQRRRVQSYVETLVEAAIQNARQAAISGEFDVARSEISMAMQTVEERKSVLGAESYGMYMDQLSAMSKEVAQDEVEARKARDAQALAEAESAKKAMRSQQEIERQKKIQEYLDTAATLQEETRYEAALGALEQVLAIDPLNQTARVQKELIEKLIIYRDYRDAKTREAREEQKLKVEVAKNAIPYVDVITYPNDWRELEKRRQEGKVGDTVMAAEDVEVYRQLDTVVDLSQLTPDTPLGEAFDMLMRSVQPELPLFVNWGDLRNSALTQQSPTNMQGLPRVKLSQGLDMLLSAAGGGFVDLGYTVNNGLVVVATRLMLPKNLVTHVYPVGDILGVPSNATFGDVSSGSTGGTGTTGTGTTGTGTTGTSSTGSTGTGTGTTGTGTTGTTTGSTTATGGGGESSIGGLDLIIPAEDLITAIIDGTEQINWFDYGGDGTIRILGGNRLVIRQTPKIHSEIAEILDNLRKHLGEQVALEARFLLVDESYIEEIGLDVDFQFNTTGKFGIIPVTQNSFDVTTRPELGQRALTTNATYGGILDDLQVSFLLNATQQNANSLVFTAPKVTVLSNETAGISVTREQTYTSGYDSSGIVATQGVVTQGVIVPVIDRVSGGVSMSITPTISQDKKYVLLNIRTSLGDFTISEAFLPYTLTDTSEPELFKYELPLVDNTIMETRVYVPDKGTLLIGGQKIKRHSEIESGVPMLSKVPYLGRLFSNRSKSEETKVLLILVRPTIIFTSETEADHVSSLTEGMSALR